MSKGNILYQVCAGTQEQGYCRVVYETTKESEAYDFVKKLEKDPDCEYTKIYIVRKPLAKFNKRDAYE